MKTLTRKVCVFGAAMILAMLLSGARGLPSRAFNECERNTSWNIWNELDSRQRSDTVNGKTTNTQDVSDRSEHHSSRGEESTSLQTHRTNADGSSHGHQEYHYSDPEGKGCHNSDGIPWKGDLRGDDDVDAKGNHKRHVESINEKGGICTKYVDDYEWDRKGKLIKETHTKTEVPCNKWSLEVSFNGFIDVSHSTITYGPNTVVVYLETKANTYEGKYEGVFDAKMTGKCEGFGTFPVSYDVTASKEDEFGDLDFSVKESMGASATVFCLGGSGSDTEPTKTNTYTFKLPAEDGASHTESIPPGYVTLTFTLKKR